MEEIKKLAEKCEESSLTLLDEVESLDVIQKSLVRLLEDLNQAEGVLKDQHPVVSYTFAGIRDEMRLILMASEFKKVQLVDLTTKLAKDTVNLNINMKLDTIEAKVK